MSYFRALCLFWALVGLMSRFFILKMGEEWNRWELDSAYTESKPKWIYLLAVLGVSLVAYTWYQVVVTDVQFSWIIALLVSLTLIKIVNLIFNYNKFREFVVNILDDKKRWRQLNISVVAFSIVLIMLGIFIY